MIAHVIDDFFDAEFLAKLESKLLDIPVYSTNVANATSFPAGNVGSHRLFGVDIFARESVNRVDALHKDASTFFDAFDLIEQHLFAGVPVFLKRIDINLQYYGQDGTGHKDGSDDSDVTVMIMNNTRWKSEWGGQFQILGDDRETIVEEHEYIPGRVLIFPGKLWHRGLAPLTPYGYRYTTVFRIVVEEDD